MNWKSQLLKNSCFSPVIKLLNLNVSQLSQSFGLINASSFGTAHKTLPTHPSVQEHKELFTKTKFTVPSYQLYKVTETVLLSMVLFIIHYQLKNKFRYLYTSTNGICYCCFSNYWGLVPPWFQFSTWHYISQYEAPLLYPGDFPQVFKTSIINPSV